MTIVFGLKMDSAKVQRLIEYYYLLVDMGLPFLSCFPEEFVLSAIIGRPEFHHWTKSIYMDYFFTRAGPSEQDSAKKIQDARKNGYFFYQRKH